jgi:RNA polymerase sigma factor (sigma-70 family)
VNTLTDQQLLRDYTGRRSETAFAELVRRHVDLVYSAALRMVRDAHLAEDVTQGVFVALAQNARQLTDRSVLSGWLHRTTQNLAANAVRSDVRRRAREKEAAAMNELPSAEPDTVWENIAPHLDTALGELSEPDRDALLLRYFERKSAREMAEVLGTSEEAAQKRVSRAVERLRDLFAKRGVTVGASGLVIVISANAVQAAPAGLAITISTAGALTGTAVQTSTAIATTKAIAMTTLQKTVVAATLAVVTGTGIYEGHQAFGLREQNQSLQQQQTPLTEQIQQLQKKHDDASTKLAALQGENEQLRRDTAELAKLRGEVSRLRADARKLAQSKAAGDQSDQAESAVKSLLNRVNKLKQKLEETPNAKIPEFQFLTDEDWVDTVRGNLESESDLRKAFSLLRGHAEHHFLESMEKALQKYIKTNNEQFPTDLSQLKPYFQTTPSDDMLQRYKIVPADSLASVFNRGDWLITQKAFIDEENDTQYDLGRNGLGGASYRDAAALNALAPAMEAFKAAASTNSNGPISFSLQQLVPYLTTPEQKATYYKLTHQKSPDSQ